MKGDRTYEMPYTSTELLSYLSPSSPLTYFLININEVVISKWGGHEVIAPDLVWR